MNEITIDEVVCKGCGICIEECKGKVLVPSKRRNAKGYLVPEPKNMEDCVLCRNCEMLCPDMAVEVKKGEE